MADPAAWAAAVTAVLSGIFAFAKWLLPFLREWDKSRTDTKTIRGFAKYQKLYLALQAIQDAGVQRAIIFAGHNGGGIPKPGSPFYVSALHWTTEDPDRGGPSKYQQLPVDAGYISMLVNAMSSGEIRYKTKEMTPCQLRDIYLAEGVEDSLVVYLGTHERQLFYMSAATFYGGLTDTQLTEIRLQANVIRNILTT
jgi:hypothetical protein